MYSKKVVPDMNWESVPEGNSSILKCSLASSNSELSICTTEETPMLS